MTCFLDHRDHRQKLSNIEFGCVDNFPLSTPVGPAVYALPESTCFPLENSNLLPHFQPPGHIDP
jgi:hypothetical protein